MNTKVTQENIIVVSNAIEQNVDNHLLQKLLTHCTEEEQQLFVQSFYMYLRYGEDDTAFVINLDDIWEWIGFGNKGNCKASLEKHFQEGIHYTVALLHPQKRKNEGGHNKETIMMTVDTFKDLCMRSNTERAKTVRGYYIKMEKIMHQYTKECMIEEQKRVREKVLIESFHMKPIDYAGTFDFEGEELAKLGSTKDAKTRIADHKREIGNGFMLQFVTECEHYETLEKRVINHPDIKSRRVTRTIHGKVQTEPIKLDEKFGIDKIKKIVLDLKKTVMLDKDMVLEHQAKIREMEHKERIMELQLEMKKVELEMKKLENTQPNNSEQNTSKKIHKQTKVAFPKAVLQFSLDNKLIKKFSSIVEAAKETGANRKSISAVCCGRRQKHYGFIWKHAE